MCVCVQYWCECVRCCWGCFGRSGVLRVHNKTSAIDWEALNEYNSFGLVSLRTFLLSPSIALKNRETKKSNTPDTSAVATIFKPYK